MLFLRIAHNFNTINRTIEIVQPFEMVDLVGLFVNDMHDLFNRRIADVFTFKPAKREALLGTVHHGKSFIAYGT